MAFMDQIKQNIEAAQAPADQQQTFQDIMKARTGKAIQAPSVPKASAVQQQQAQQQVKVQKQQQQAQARTQEALGVKQIQDQVAAYQQARDQLGQKKDLAMQQLTATESMKVDESTNRAKNMLKELAANKGITQDQLLTKFKEAKDTLTLEKNRSELEATLTAMALNDKTYMSELQMIGQARGLANDLNFKEEAAKLAYGASVNDLLDRIEFSKESLATRHEAESEMAKLDIDTVLALAATAADAANTKGIIKGATTLAMQAPAAYGAYQKYTEQPEVFAKSLGETKEVPGQLPSSEGLA